MGKDLQPCLRCGVAGVDIEEWFCGDNPKPSFRCECVNGHSWDEWFENKEDAINAWNEKPIEEEYGDL